MSIFERVRRLFGRPQRVTLIAMREADMVLVHPCMDTQHVCVRCRETVGLFPSGQAVLRQNARVDIVCQHCVTDREGQEAALVPGIELELQHLQARS